jgi:hypothetical protein
MSELDGQVIEVYHFDRLNPVAQERAYSHTLAQYPSKSCWELIKLIGQIWFTDKGDIVDEVFARDDVHINNSITDIRES